MPRWVAKGARLHERHALDALHEHRVAVLVDGRRHGQAALAESLHEGVLLYCREAREVEPAVVVALAQVVALRLDSAERGAPEAVQLQRHDGAIFARHLRAARGRLMKWCLFHQTAKTPRKVVLQAV